MSEIQLKALSAPCDYAACKPNLNTSISGQSTSSLVTHTINLPSCIKAGDLVVVLISSATNQGIVVPSGWASIRGDQISGSHGYFREIHITATQPMTTVDVTCSASTHIAYTAYCFTTAGISLANSFSNIYTANPDVGEPNTPVTPKVPLYQIVATAWMDTGGGSSASLTGQPFGYNDGQHSPGNSSIKMASGAKYLCNTENPGPWQLSSAQETVAYAFVIEGNCPVGVCGDSYDCYPEAVISSSGTSPIGTSHLIVVPPCIEPNDLILIGFGVGHDINEPAGYTFPGGWTPYPNTAVISGTPTYAMYYKVATGTETNFTVSTNEPRATGYTLHVIRNAQIIARSYSDINYNASPNPGEPEPIDVTPGPKYQLVSTFWSNNGTGLASLLSYPSGYTTHQTTAASGDVGIAAALKMVCSSEDPGAFSLSKSSDYHVDAFVIGPNCPPQDCENAACRPYAMSSHSGQSAAASSTHTVTLPTGIQTGDLVVLLLSSASKDGINVPSGWSSIRADEISGSGPDGFYLQLYKVATGPMSSVAISCPVSTHLAYIGYRFESATMSLIHTYGGQFTASPDVGKPNQPSDPLGPLYQIVSIAWVDDSGAGTATATLNSYPTGYGLMQRNPGNANIKMAAALRYLCSTSNPDPWSLSQSQETVAYAFVVQANCPSGGVINEIGSGGVVAGGTSTVRRIIYRSSSGGVVAGGTSTVRRIIYRSSSGGVVAGGTSTVRCIIYKTSSGGVVAGGTSTVRCIIYKTSSGGVILAGSKLVKRVLENTSSGGVVLSGNVFTEQSSSIDLVASGGVRLAGTLSRSQNQSLNTAGGVRLAGTLSRSQNQSLNTAGGVKLAGTLIRNRIQNVIAAGGVITSGALFRNLIQSPNTSGGVRSAGTLSRNRIQNPNNSGGVVASGVNFLENGRDHDGQGGVRVSGIALDNLIGIFRSNGGVLVSGTSLKGVNFTKSPGGGVVVSGIAISQVDSSVNSFNDMTGGVLVSGLLTSTKTGSKASAGGVLVGGSGANESSSTYSETMSGGVVVSGENTNESSSTYSETMSGGVVVGGKVGIFSIIYEYGACAHCNCNDEGEDLVDREFNGGVVVSGAALLLVSGELLHYFYTADGGLFIEGQSSFGKTSDYSYVGSGSLDIDSTPAFIKHTFAFDLEFISGLQSSFYKDLDFEWNTGSLTTYWYRVIGKGRPGDECNLAADPCCQKFIINIHARTPAELCKKLQARRLNLPVDSVQRFSRPAFNSQIRALEDAGISQECNELIPVEICHIPECAEFCIDFDLRIGMQAGSKSQLNAFFAHEAEGLVFAGGASPYVLETNVPGFSYTSIGGIEIEGGSISLSSDHSYVAEDGLFVSGESGYNSSNWSFVGGEKIIETMNIATVAISSPGNNGIVWSNPTKAIIADGVYAQADVSTGKISEALLLKGFYLNIPEGNEIVSVEVDLLRHSSQIKLKDYDVFLFENYFIASDNLSKTADWPLIPTKTTYVATWSNPYTPSQINNPEFGVILRVYDTGNLNGSIASVDEMSIRAIHYDPTNPNEFIIGGGADFRSDNWKYKSDGDLIISGSAGLRLSLHWIPRGGLDFSGNYNSGEAYQGEGSIEVYGTSPVHSNSIIASGGLTASGLAEVAPSIMSGGMKTGGKARLGYKFRLVASGLLELSGGAAISRTGHNYIADGFVEVLGNAVVSTSNYAYVSEGTLVVEGSGSVHGTDLGDYVENAGFNMFVRDILVTFNSEKHLGNAVLGSDVVDQCGCYDLPMIIGLDHNLAKNNVFSQFLVRNNLTISKKLKMFYNVTNDSWQSNIHFKGYATDIQQLETWNLVFDLQCTNVIGGVNIGQKIWKLAFNVFQRNETTGKTVDTRLVLAALPLKLCGGDQLDFVMTYNTNLGFASVQPNATMYQNILFDNIGMFKNRYWMSNPNIILKVSEGGFEGIQQRVNLTDAVLV